ncbi:hypothetical protein EV2_043583 [Malus domestica]
MYLKKQSCWPAVKALRAVLSSASAHREYSWLKRPTYIRNDSSGFWRIVYKSSAECKRSVWKMCWETNSFLNSSNESTVSGVRRQYQFRAPLERVEGKRRHRSSSVCIRYAMVDSKRLRCSIGSSFPV